MSPCFPTRGLQSSSYLFVYSLYCYCMKVTSEYHNARCPVSWGLHVSPCFVSCCRYADKWDIMAVALGFLGSAANGASMPIFTLLFGDLINSFGLNLGNPNALSKAVNEKVVLFVYLGLGCFIAAYAQVFFFTGASSTCLNVYEQGAWGRDPWTFLATAAAMCISPPPSHPRWPPCPTSLVQ